MATTNYSWNLPTVGASEDTWGTSLNSNWTALDTLLGGVSQTEFAKLDGLTASTAELNLLDGLTASTAELNLLTGVTSLPSIPSGLISLWSGSIASIPAGWLLCDGTNGTPNLQDRFVVGAGNSYAVNDTGGADSVTLTSSQIPAHTHTFSGTTSTTGAHTHAITIRSSGESLIGQNAGYGGNGVTGNASTGSAGNHNHTFSGTTSSTGSDSSHENRPPYYALAYIMKA